MRLADCEMRPGKVLAVVDDHGTIKASCAGVFSEDEDTGLLPPVWQAPFIKSSRFYFAAPQVGDLIWVIINHDNPQELFYCFRDDVNDNSGELDSGPADAEIGMKRADPNDHSKTTLSVTYDTDNGYRIVNGDEKASGFNIDNTEDHDLHLDHSSGIGLHLAKDKISLGSKGGSKYKAVCGEPLVSALDAIVQALQAIASSATQPHAAPIKAALEPLIPQLKMAVAQTKILSEKVTLDK